MQKAKQILMVLIVFAVALEGLSAQLSSQCGVCGEGGCAGHGPSPAEIAAIVAETSAAATEAETAAQSAASEATAAGTAASEASQNAASALAASTAATAAATKADKAAIGSEDCADTATSAVTDAKNALSQISATKTRPTAGTMVETKTAVTKKSVEERAEAFFNSFDSLSKKNQALQVSANAKAAAGTAAIAGQAEADAAETAGDPVIVSTGQYELTVTDIETRAFDLTRRHVSGTPRSGSFGPLWSCSLDSRIIRGRSQAPTLERDSVYALESDIAAAHEMIQSLRDAYQNEIMQALHDDDVKQLNAVITAKNDVSRLIKKLADFAGRASQAASNAGDIVRTVTEQHAIAVEQSKITEQTVAIAQSSTERSFKCESHAYQASLAAKAAKDRAQPSISGIAEADQCAQRAVAAAQAAQASYAQAAQYASKARKATVKINNYPPLAETSVARIEAARSSADAYLQTAIVAVSECDSILASGKNTQPGIEANLDAFYAERMRGLDELISATMTELDRTMAETESALAQAKRLCDELRDTDGVNERLRQLNRLALYDEQDAVYETIGNGRLVVIDYDGTPIQFDSSGPGSWNPASGTVGTRRAYRLRSVDGKGAESTSGFTLFGNRGEKRRYDGLGLLVSVETAYGHTTEIKRKAESREIASITDGKRQYLVTSEGGKISAIAGPESTLTRYGYESGQLVSVIDIDGDRVEYVYDGSGIAQVIKPDGSAIRVEYSLARSDGSRYVTATIDEEGNVERFDYDLESRRTKHVNPSGITTWYSYDERRRTVRKDYADRSADEYRYDAETGLVAWRNERGNITQYQYDGRGNVTLIKYSDGSSESFSWNDRDQPLRASDRDGVITTWQYDGQHRCIYALRGPYTVYSAEYGSGPLPLRVRNQTGALFEYRYDADKEVIGIDTNVDGERYSEGLSRDALGRVLSRTDGAGQVTKYAYAGRTLTETTPSGLVRETTRNERKDPVRVEERDTVTGETRITMLAYDKRHNLLSERVNNDQERTYAYRSDGLLLSETSGPWETKYSHDSIGRLREITRGNAELRQRTTERRSYQRDNDGKTMEAREVDGKVQGYYYDQWQRLTAITNEVDETVSARLTPAGRALALESPWGGWTETAFDSGGMPATVSKKNAEPRRIEYNEIGLTSAVIDETGTRTDYSYNNYGLLAETRTANGTIKYQYDGARRLTKKVTTDSDLRVIHIAEWAYSQDGRSVTLTEGERYTTVWRLDAWGKPIAKQNASGTVLSQSYDARGRISSIKDAYQNETRYEWNDIDKLTETIYPDGARETRQYDHLGRLTQIADSAGIKWQGNYDERGLLLQEKARPGVDRTYEYDAAGRLTLIKSGNDVIETRSYQNRATEITVRDGNQREYAYRKNEFGLLVGETDRQNNTQSYQYDGMDRLTAHASLSGKQTITNYDETTGISSIKAANGETVNVTRLITGAIVAAKGPSGTIQFDYDTGGKLIRQSDLDAGDITVYEYNRNGERTRLRSQNRDIRYEYGLNGELLSTKDATSGLSVTFAYNARGQEISRRFGNGLRQETEYDEIGRTIMIRELTVNGDIIHGEAYLYDEVGRRSHTIDATGAITSYDFDRQSRIANVKYAKTQQRFDTGIAEAAYAGLFYTEVSEATDMLDAQTADRLKKAISRISPGLAGFVAASRTVWTESFTYDGNGNRTTKTTPCGTIQYQYDAENRLTSMGQIEFTYDHDGNLITEQGPTRLAKYEYSGFNRLSSATIIDKKAKTISKIAYTYDGLGRRALVADSSASPMRTVYDGLSFDVIKRCVSTSDGVLCQYGQDSIPTPAQDAGAGTRYRYVGSVPDAEGRTETSDDDYKNSCHFLGLEVPLYANGEMIARFREGDSNAISAPLSTSARYISTDVMRSAISLSDDVGNVISAPQYDAFGVPTVIDQQLDDLAIYAGKTYDSLSGLYDYGYRDYSPLQSRFSTVDPIRDGSNWYAYANNDPVNYVDLWGLCVSEGMVSPIKKGSLTSASGTYNYYKRDGTYVEKNHKGIDVSAPLGTPVYAATSGKITEIRKNIDGYGNSVEITDSNGLSTRYSHMKDTPAQQIGEVVIKGTQIGQVGNTTATGASTGPHLDFEVTIKDTVIDPIIALGGLPIGITPIVKEGYVTTNDSGGYVNWLLPRE